MSIESFSYKMAWNYYGFNETGNTNPFGLAAIPVAGFQRQQCDILVPVCVLESCSGIGEIETEQDSRFAPGGKAEMNLSMLRIGKMLLCGCAAIFASTITTRADDAASVYKAKCAACHAADGSGSSAMGKQLAAPDLRSDAVQKETDAQLNDSITNGKGKKMPRIQRQADGRPNQGSRRLHSRYGKKEIA